MQIKTQITLKIFAFMIKYNSDRQLTIEEFKTPFQTSLLADKLSCLILISTAKSLPQLWRSSDSF